MIRIFAKFFKICNKLIILKIMYIYIKSTQKPNPCISKVLNLFKAAFSRQKWPHLPHFIPRRVYGILAKLWDHFILDLKQLYCTCEWSFKQTVCFLCTASSHSKCITFSSASMYSNLSNWKHNEKFEYCIYGVMFPH